MLIRNVLVAVDGSENSDRAIDFAADFASKFDASLTILNVSEALAVSSVPQGPGAYANGTTAQFVKDLRQVHNDILTKSVARVKAAKPDLTVSSMLKEGDATLEIVNFADSGGFDVIVIGHKGLSRVGDRFQSWNSEKVAHLAHCNTIIVK